MAILSALKYLLVMYTVFFVQGCSVNNEPLKYASHVWPGFELVFLGNNLGWVDSQKVQLQETSSGTHSLQLLRESKVG